MGVKFHSITCEYLIFPPSFIEDLFFNTEKILKSFVH